MVPIVWLSAVFHCFRLDSGTYLKDMWICITDQGVSKLFWKFELKSFCDIIDNCVGSVGTAKQADSSLLDAPLVRIVQYKVPVSLVSKTKKCAVPCPSQELWSWCVMAILSDGRLWAVVMHLPSVSVVDFCFVYWNQIWIHESPADLSSTPSLLYTVKQVSCLFGKISLKCI